MSDRFQVDLAGMVDLLSRHLYSGPQVYVRELIQNAVDAVTARRALDPEAPATIRISTGETPAGEALVEVVDTGVGLTAAEAAELLATIGRSSKRDPSLGLGRAEFIGQFGIGMLAAFMVADRIEVRSRSAVLGAAPILWEGRAEGTFEVTELAANEGGAAEEIPVGTTVRVIARAEAAHWLAADTVLGLAREYGSLLPFDISVLVPVDGDEPAWRRITEPELPWRVEYRSRGERSAALAEYCERTFGFTLIAAIDLELPVAGVSGVAFLLPQAVSPGSGQHRVYMKRMLLGQRIDRVLPDWAFFARAVIDTETLSPTASREQLHDDELLMTVRDALGAQMKQWVTETLRSPSGLARRVIEVHHLALRALAVTDPEMLELVAEVLPFETSDGVMTLAEAAARGEIVYTSTTEAYRRVAAVARAQGLAVVNAGYVYDADLLQRLGSRGGWRVRELESADLVQILAVPSLARELEVADAVARARDLLETDDCDVIVRGFAPDSVPAILLRDAEGEHRRDLDRERDEQPDLWGGLLDGFAEERAARTRTLVLNDDCEVAQRLLAAPAGEVFAAGLRSLYLSAVMLAGEGLRGSETTAFSGALGVLLGAALGAPTGSALDRDQGNDDGPQRPEEER
ncbi:HSP90 family protein [Leucobacter sp. CSA2]|uniref:HSP90 family protein n=1 Tax=Leucobacter edaphi TaxID=2796472 RepID=A0A934QBK4_9MICO|nr:HSP90 family protein [Leucobacter edaphi]MBK0420850.1 HSP90 family protein [Leucobacter edaphi]